MKEIYVWTEDIKKAIDQWYADGIKAVQLYTHQNKNGNTHLIINGVECGGLGLIAADEEIHTITKNEIPDIP